MVGRSNISFWITESCGNMLCVDMLQWSDSLFSSVGKQNSGSGLPAKVIHLWRETP